MHSQKAVKVRMGSSQLSKEETLRNDSTCPSKLRMESAEDMGV